MPKLVRGPDVSFTAWTQRPGRTTDTDAISKVIPTLVVEVLSKSNTRGEIARKLKDYFFADVRLVWVIDPRKRTANAYTAPDAVTAIPLTAPSTAGLCCPASPSRWATLFVDLPALAAKKPSKRKKK